MSSLKNVKGLLGKVEHETSGSQYLHFKVLIDDPKGSAYVPDSYSLLALVSKSKLAHL